MAQLLSRRKGHNLGSISIITSDDIALWILAGTPCVVCKSAPRFGKGYTRCEKCIDVHKMGVTTIPYEWFAAVRYLNELPADYIFNEPTV